MKSGEFCSGNIFLLSSKTIPNKRSQVCFLTKLSNLTLNFWITLVHAMFDTSKASSKHAQNEFPAPSRSFSWTLNLLRCIFFSCFTRLGRNHNVNEHLMCELYQKRAITTKPWILDWKPCIWIEELLSVPRFLLSDNYLAVLLVWCSE